MKKVAVGADARVEEAVQGAVGVEPGDALAGNPKHIVELAHIDYLAVSLRGIIIDGAVKGFVPR